MKVEITHNIKAESVGGGLYEVFKDGQKLSGLYTLEEYAAVCDKEAQNGKSNC